MLSVSYSSVEGVSHRFKRGPKVSKKATKHVEPGEMALTNAHIMMATAPSKKVQRLRRKAQLKASKTIEKAMEDSNDSD